MKYLFLFWLCILSGCVSHPNNSKNVSMVPDTSCQWTQKNVLVDGVSLSGIFNDGDIVPLQEGYYDCFPHKRNDIVVLDSSSQDILIKRLVGLPGDTIESKQGTLWINQQPLLTTQGNRYNTTEMLDYYIRTYHHTIPPQSVLVLGNLSNGSYDGGFFGFTPIQALRGKVIQKKPIQHG